MFTVKFLTFHESGSSHESTQTSIQCPHYEVNAFDYGWSVVTYPGMTNENGVERHVTTNDQLSSRYDVCFVENVAGKTIDTYRA